MILLDKNYLKESYNQLSEDFQKTLESLKDYEINQTPSNSGWTVAQVVSHITKANDSRFLIAKGRSCDRSPVERIPELENIFMNFELKMESPEFILPDQKVFSKEACILNVKKCFLSLIDRLEDCNTEEIIKTPFGDLTKWEMANFLIFHSKRHLFQLRNLALSLKVEHRATVALAFSLGKFNETYPFLAKNIHWTVIGERSISGKNAVFERCEQVAAYFSSVEIDFKTEQIIKEDSNVVIRGTAKFIRNMDTISFVSACDVYEFNKDNLLVSINSYCIPIT
mgnify:CR=1 FL=1